MCKSSFEDDAAHTTYAETNRHGGQYALKEDQGGFNSWNEPANGIESEFSLQFERFTPHRIGSQYVVGMFREYKSNSFSTLLNGARSRANPVSQHLAMQGPVIRAKPGERVRVHLKNHLRFGVNFVISGIRPIGGSASERPLQPGETRELVYVFPETVSPGTVDGDSVAFHYTSDLHAARRGQSEYNGGEVSASEFADYDSGLYGAAIVTRGGRGRGEDGAPKDVNREFVLFVGAMNLNKSPYLPLNVRVCESRDISSSEPQFLHTFL